jgi:hypothetical protein
VEVVVVLHPEINNEIKMRMKQRILHNAKGYVLGGLAIVTATLMSCSNKENRYVFNNAQDAVTACHQELATLRPMTSANIDELAGLTVNWIELQDSTMNVMMRDSTLRNDAVLTTDYFATADSIRAEIMRLALSEKRTMAEVVNLKINVSCKQGDLMQSEQMSEAKKFYLDFNKRIIQSAVDVRSQMAKRNGELTDQQRSNYRWLLIQPFLVMDNYGTAALTPQQEKLLVELAEQLPELLAALDGHTDQGDAEKLTSVLSEYFLKSYLKSVL